MASAHNFDNYNSGIDPSDMDCFFDFSQTDFNSQNLSRPTTSKLSPSSATIDPVSTMVSPDHDEKPQFFSAPSHDYRRFKQQTPLPTGAISKVTTVNNTFDSDAKYSMNSADLDFGAPMGYNSGIGMEMDFESTPPTTALPAYFYPQHSSASDEYIDPSAIAAEEPASNVGRLWPGMHSQQAEQAKADANAKRQLQHQMMQQRAQQHNVPIQSQPRARSQSHATTDPAVEERISRLLDQMRHSSTSSTDDATSPDSALPHVARMRKDEEDMDEDERLLASEEGKKLSSKERRQLRNKVSARAFRSRRKEYISQLEGEVNAKAEECDELRLQVRRLTDQNAQLTSLTQTLLRHPAFSTVLTEMSNDPSIIAPPQQSAPKDVNPYQASHQHSNSLQVGMTMMPETSIDFSALNIGATHWNNADPFNYPQPQVFSLFNLPEGPVDYFRSDALSGKADSKPRFSDMSSKLDAPVIDRIAPKAPKIEEAPVDVSDIKDDPAFALFVDSPATFSSPPVTVAEAARLFESSLTGKPNQYSLVVAPRRAVSENDLDRMLAAADAICESLESLTR